MAADLQTTEQSRTQPNRFDDGSGAATLHKRKQFLEAYAASGSIVAAAKATEISRQAYYYWLSDPEFETAATQIEAWYTQQLRDTVLERTGDATKNELVRFQYTCFELKRRDPAYRDNFKVEVNLGVQVSAGDWGAAMAALDARDRSAGSDQEVIDGPK